MELGVDLHRDVDGDLHAGLAKEGVLNCLRSDAETDAAELEVGVEG